MNFLLLISNLVEAGLMLAAGLVLLLVRSTDSPAVRYYRRAKRWMAIAFLVGGLSILVALRSERYHDGQIEILNIYSLSAFFLGSITLLLSFVYLYKLERLTTRMLAWIFAPVAVLMALYVLADIWWESPVIYSLEELESQLFTSPLLLLRVLILVAVVCSILVTAWRFMLARRAYRAMLDDYFSGEDEVRRLKWIDQLFLWFLLLMPTAVGAYLISSQWYDLFYGLVLIGGMILYLVRLLNYRNDFLLIAPAVELAQTTAPPSCEPADSIAYMLVEKWVRQPEKPYLTPGLTIADVACATGLGKQRLSVYVNSVLGKNFNSWITELRILEVERLLEDRSLSLTLSQIADRTGFADLAAMSNAFKKVMGTTPSAYRKQLPERR